MEVLILMILGYVPHFVRVLCFENIVDNICSPLICGCIFPLHLLHLLYILLCEPYAKQSICTLVSSVSVLVNMQI